MVDFPKSVSNRLYPDESPIISFPLSEVRRGRLFYASKLVNLPVAGISNLLFRTGDIETLTTGFETSGRIGDIVLRVLANAVVSNPGVPGDVRNYNLRAPKTPNASTFNDPVFTDGDIIFAIPFLGDISGSKTTLTVVDGSYSKHFEFAPNSDYIIQLENIDATLDADINLSFDFREK